MGTIHESVEVLPYLLDNGNTLQSLFLKNDWL